MVFALRRAFGCSAVTKHERSADAEAVSVRLIHDARYNVVSCAAVDERNTVPRREEWEVEFGVLRDVVHIRGITPGSEGFWSDEPVEQFRVIAVADGVLVPDIDERSSTAGLRDGG